MKNIFKLILFVCICPFFIHAQDTGLSLFDEEPETEYVKNAFKSSRVINGHSMEMIAKGALDFRIMHRFGLLNDPYNMFGLDQASMRMSFDYGIMKNLSVGIGRSTFKKEVDGFVKVRILQQSTGKKVMPVSVLLVAGTTLIGQKFPDPTRENLFTQRMGYYYQAIIGRKFSPRFTLQLTPTVVHRNFVEKIGDPNDTYALGIGGRIMLTKRLGIMADYFYSFNRFDGTNTYNPLSFGVDIETGGHVFQLHFSNTSGMNERAFIVDTFNRWGKAEIRLGFNLSRMFQLVN